MIINGGSRSNGAFFASHLSKGEHNERVTLCEMRNLAATSIPDALREMQAVAMGTFCKKFFYHANINPRGGELLTLSQWEQAVNTLERHLGLGGTARFVVEHVKLGRTHRHVIWSRIDVRRMRAIKMTDDYAKHQAAARELERAFGLDTVDSVLGSQQQKGKRPQRRPKAWESFRGKRTGIDATALTQLVTEIFHTSQDAQAFIAALKAHGYSLVKGNTAEFCLVDPAGHLHSLARRLAAVPAAEFRAFMTGVPPFFHSQD